MSVVVADLCVVEGVRSRVAEGRGPVASTGCLVLAREAPLRGAHGGRSCGASAPHATCRAEQLVQSSLFRAASPHASSQTSFPVFHPSLSTPLSSTWECPLSSPCRGPPTAELCLPPRLCGAFLLEAEMRVCVSGWTGHHSARLQTRPEVFLCGQLSSHTELPQALGGLQAGPGAPSLVAGGAG